MSSKRCGTPNVEVPPDIPTFGQPPAIYRHFQDQVPPNIRGGFQP